MESPIDSLFFNPHVLGSSPLESTIPTSRSVFSELIFDSEFFQHGVQLFQSLRFLEFGFDLNLDLQVLCLGEAREDFQAEQIPLLPLQFSLPHNRRRPGCSRGGRREWRNPRER